MDEDLLAGTPVYPRSMYVSALRPHLPAAVFEPARSRLLWIPVHLTVITTAIVAIAHGWVPLYVAPLLSLVIGVAFAGLTFLAHETLHGGVVHDKRVQRAVGWLGFLPFLVSPRLWMSWHNGVHHAQTTLPGDPDSYPTLAHYRSSRTVRMTVDAFSLGGGRWRGGLSLILGFTVQSLEKLREHLATPGGRRERPVIVREMLLAVAVWATLLWLVGPLAFVFVYVIPLLVANVCVMSFILTNHSLSPRLSTNDPLLNSLTVTDSRVVEWLTLGFGYHVEHHLFPAMSARHAGAVRTLVQERWPERYQSMGHGEALGRLHRTARVYKDATTLVDPRTGAEHPTLLPRPVAAVLA